MARKAAAVQQREEEALQSGGLMEVEDVQRYLKVGRDKIFDLMKQGLPHLYLGERALRFRRHKVDRWLDELESRTAQQQ